MKTKKILMLSTLLSFCVGAFCLSNVNESSIKQVKADGDTPVQLGYLYKIQRVSTTTKVIINSDSMRLILTELGRTVYSEWIEGDDPWNPPPWNPPWNPPGPGIPIGDSLPDNPNYIVPQPTLQYYYYADVNNPIIIEKRAMYNDVTSLKYAIQYLEDQAAQLNVSDIKNAVLGYIRTINKNYHYTDCHLIPLLDGNFNVYVNSFTAVCGEPDTSFIASVNSVTNCGDTINNYFKHFVEATDYNSIYHGTVDFGQNHSKIRLIDPTTGYATIDLIHLFASIDGIVDGTRANGFMVGIGEWVLNYTNIEAYFKNIVSWTGDLQSCALKVEYEVLNNSFEYNSFETILLDEDLSFALEDFLADLDAINVSYNVNLTNSVSISTLISNYYLGLQSNTYKRIGAFFDNMISMNSFMTNSNQIDFDKARDIIYDSLLIDEDGNDKSTITNNLTYKIRYALLKKDDGTYPAYSVRKRLADLFLEILFDNLDENDPLHI